MEDVENIFSTENTILVVLIVIAIGITFFLLTGFIHVKKGYIAIIEKTGEFVGIYHSGMHYFTPLAYRRVGLYKIGVIKRKVLVNRDYYYITFEILDYYKFHYEGKHNVDGALKSALNDRFTDLSSSLNAKFKNMGATFIKLEKIKRR